MSRYNLAWLLLAAHGLHAHVALAQSGADSFPRPEPVEPAGSPELQPERGTSPGNERDESSRPGPGSKEVETDPQKLEQAREHFQRAVQFFNDGDFKLSLVEFRRSYELSRNYRVLYNIGQVNHQLSNYTKALNALEQYLAEGREDVPEERRVEVVKSIEELRKKVARVRVQINVDVVELWVDDQLMGSIRPGQLVIMDAGDHRIELRRAGYQPATSQVSLSAGESSQISAELRRSPAERPPPGSSRDQVSSRSPSGLIWLGWFVTGASAVGAGVTGVIAQKHAGDLRGLRDSPDSTPEEREAARNRARSFAIASDAMTGAAILIGAASLYFTLSSGKSSNTGGATPTKLGLGPTGVTLSRRF